MTTDQKITFRLLEDLGYEINQDQNERWRKIVWSQTGKTVYTASSLANLAIFAEGVIAGVYRERI